MVSGILSHSYSSGAVLRQTHVLSSAWAALCSLPGLGERLRSLSSVFVSATWVMAARMTKVTVVTHRLGAR